MSGALVAAATATMIFFLVKESLDPNQYIFYDDSDRSAWTHPTRGVLVLSSIVAVEGFFVWFACFGTVPRATLLRVLLAIALFTPWALASSMLVMHAPGYVLLHILWVWMLELLLVIALLVAAVSVASKRIRS